VFTRSYLASVGRVILHHVECRRLIFMRRTVKSKRKCSHQTAWSPRRETDVIVFQSWRAVDFILWW